MFILIIDGAPNAPGVPIFEPEPHNGNADLMFQCTVIGEEATLKHVVQWFVGGENVGETNIAAGSTRSNLDASTITVELYMKTVR